MFKLLVICFMGIVAAAPQAQRASPAPQEVQLLSYESNNDGLGNYKYSFEQSDGTKREEQGELKNAGTENEAMFVKGFYTWIAPDGIMYTVNYVADENGYRPTIQRGSTDEGGVPPGVVASLLG